MAHRRHTTAAAVAIVAVLGPLSVYKGVIGGCKCDVQLSRMGVVEITKNVAEPQTIRGRCHIVDLHGQGYFRRYILLEPV